MTHEMDLTELQELKKKRKWQCLNEAEILNQVFQNILLLWNTELPQDLKP